MRNPRRPRRFGRIALTRAPTGKVYFGPRTGRHRFHKSDILLGSGWRMPGINLLGLTYRVGAGLDSEVLAPDEAGVRGHLPSSDSGLRSRSLQTRCSPSE